MDCQMPGMDGFTATAEIRKSEALKGRRVPIIALTAHAMDGDEARCIAAGMDDYLAKPFSLGALRAKLVRWTNASL
jgi:CheY-like chemotaxis protein